MKIMKILKKAGGILLVIIGILFFVSALKMIFVDNPKTKAALKDAVYVDAADTDRPGKRWKDSHCMRHIRAD